jgi:hypothetical protein
MGDLHLLILAGLVRRSRRNFAKRLCRKEEGGKDTRGEVRVTGFPSLPISSTKTTGLKQSPSTPDCHKHLDIQGGKKTIMPVLRISGSSTCHSLFQ